MTRDQVIEYAKDWAYLLDKWSNTGFTSNWHDEEKTDVMRAVLDLAYNRTKEALVNYAKEREEHFAAHDRLLDSIEATLRQEFRNGV